MSTAERKPALSGETAATTPPQEPAPGAGTFTRYVQALVSHSEAAVDEMAEELQAELRRTLRREMRWRSLWLSPPSYVGVLGWPRWTSDTEETASPLDEIVSDCYLFLFGERLRLLLNQLKVKAVIDGLVVIYLRGFLTDRQKVHDPLGYRLFEMLCAAVRSAVAAGELHVLRGTNSIRNETVLGVAPELDAAKAASIADLRPLVARWNDGLLPGLVTADRSERRRVTGRLRAHLSDLEADGIAVFGFKDLLDALKEDVRARWGRLRRQEAGETSVEEDNEGVRRLVRIFQPETRVEDDDSFKKLLRCVAGLIEKLDGRQKTRSYLKRLWNFLRSYAIDETQERLPPNRRLEEMLRIPRGRFPGLYETLGHLTSRCRGELSGEVVGIDAGRHRPGTSAGGRDG